VRYDELFLSDAVLKHSTPERRDHSEDLGVDGIIKLKWILEKQNGKFLIGFMCFRIGVSAGLL
jgi:hypothetical protein